MEVHAVTSRSGPRVSRPKLHWHQCDLFDRNAIGRLTAEIGASHLLHLAWDTTPGEYLHASANVDWVEASLSLLRCFCDAGGRRVTFAGTCAEYDFRHGFCVESITPLVPDTLYGASKQGLNSVASAYARQIGMSFAWGRIFFLYGPWEHPSRLVASVARALLAESRAPCTHGNQVRDFSHVQDIAGALVATLDSEVQGNVNIASGEPIKVRHLVSQLAELAGRPDLVEFGAITPRAEEPPMVVANVARLRREVGWQPQVGLQQGLQETLEFWRSQEGTKRMNG